MSVDAKMIKELRDMTNCGISDCKKALTEADGDMNKAKALLRERGLQMAQKKSGRAASEGRIEAYIHAGSKMGVLVEVNCETDFVARNDDFIAFSKELALHIAAMAPQYVREEDVPESVMAEQGDAKGMFIKSAVLLEQAFVKDASKTIQDMLNDLIAKIGENIVIGRFTRFKIGE